MREGYYLNSDEKHLYLLDSKRTPIECLTNLIENFNHINIFNGTGEMSFVIYYSDETKHIYNTFIEKMTHLRLEDYGEFIVDTAPENIEGEVRYKTVTCKDEEYMLNKRLLTLVNNSASFFSGVLWTTDTSVPCVMREFFNEVPSWSIGIVDSEIDNTKKSFRDIKKQNMLKFAYENIEQAFDCIPFFDSLNRTISFRKTKNAIDDTGIVIALSNFIDSIVKESINDTFCTRMYTEGGNLDIRRVNPDGRNYVYYYNAFYDLMSDELVSNLKSYLKAIEDNKIGYQTAFADWSEAKTKYDEASVIMKATDAEMTRWNDRYFVLDKNGASQEEKDAFFQQWEDWQHSSGRWNAADVMSAQSPIIASKKAILDNINSACNVKNFLTTEDFIELDQFETEGSYKQEAFAYIKGMSEAEKGDIAQILKTYATEEIARCNSPRYTYNVSLSNFCTIEGCEYFAESLDVGKYITLYDDVTGESVKLIVVKIETDKENPKDLKLTFSDKMTGHEKFATLNEYLNNAIKNMDDIEKTNVRIDEIETVVDSVMNKQEVLETSVSTLYENYQASSFNIETYKSPNLQTTSKNPIGAINEVFTYTADAFNTFANSIKSKGGTVNKVGVNYNKGEITNGILSISSSGGNIQLGTTNTLYVQSIITNLTAQQFRGDSVASISLIKTINFYNCIKNAIVSYNVPHVELGRIMKGTQTGYGISVVFSGGALTLDMYVCDTVADSTSTKAYDERITDLKIYYYIKLNGNIVRGGSFGDMYVTYSQDENGVYPCFWMNYFSNEVCMDTDFCLYAFGSWDTYLGAITQDLFFGNILSTNGYQSGAHYVHRLEPNKKINFYTVNNIMGNSTDFTEYFFKTLINPNKIDESYKNTQHLVGNAQSCINTIIARNVSDSTVLNSIDTTGILLSLCAFSSCQSLIKLQDIYTKDIYYGWVLNRTDLIYIIKKLEFEQSV